MFQRIRKWKWIISTLVCYFLLYILPTGFIERYYSIGFFLIIREILDNTFGKLPFPSYYIFLIVILILTIKWILHFFKEKPQPIYQRLFKIVSFGGFLATTFFILWGFNYGRIPLEKKLNLDIQQLTKKQLIAETKVTIEQLTNIRLIIKKDTNAIPQIVFINNIEENCRTALNTSLKDFKYPFSSKIRGRFLYEDIFLIFGIGGQYLPFIGEGNVDDAVFHSKKPFYLTHEMAHGNGFTEEADCNFLAYVSCVKSGNLSLEYSGELNYLLYLFFELKNRDKQVLNLILETIPIAIQKDLNEIKRYNEIHTFKTGFLGDFINDTYLKLLGIQDGVKNYDKMILLVYAWKQFDK